MAEKKIVLKVSNMTCAACEMRIEKSVTAVSGVSSVKASFGSGKVTVVYEDGKTTESEIKKAIEKQHYIIEEEHVNSKSNSISPEKKVRKNDGMIGAVLIIVALYFVLNKFGLLNIIPQVDASMGYFALFVVGLITSLHCTAMCGGINIAQCMSYKEKKENGNPLMPSFLYNAGRVTSYTIVGGIVGALGSVLSLSGYAKGLMALVAGVFMVIMGLNMLNIFPWLRKLTPRMPKLFGKKIHSKNNYGPFVVGLLNGLMPCGPLQAMQIYALGTGSAVAGATSMFLFSLGTVPLMFGLGALSSILKGKFTEKILKVGAVLVIVLGFGMFSNGMALSGIALDFSTISKIDFGQQAKKGGNYVNAAMITGNEQDITTTLGRSYTPITVQKGIPVKWTIKAEKANINGCNNKMQIPKFNITKQLVPGDNVIEFTPTASGTVPYSCWMGMIKSTITVVNDLGSASATSNSGNDSNPNTLTTTQQPKIPTDQVAVAQIKDGKQTVKISMDDKGFLTAVVVMQAGVETNWIIDASKIGIGNSSLSFPSYNAQIPMKEGQNPIDFKPESDFDFSTTDGSFYGYVKVVPDINKIDLNAIKEEVKNYTPSSNVAGAGGASCCQTQ